jgi:hypothetical protein
MPPLAPSRSLVAALILVAALAGCWLAPEPKGPDDPSGWEITKWWSGNGGEKRELDVFTVDGPWGLEWELGQLVGVRWSSGLKVELLDAQGKRIETVVDTREAGHAVKRHGPGTYKLRVEARGSTKDRMSVSWRLAVREKAGKAKATR